MRIYVCVKQVPDTAANIRPLQGAAFDEEVKYIANPYDENALELALQIRQVQPGSEIVAVTVGKDTAVATLRFALAMGADRAILIKTETYFTGHQETSHLLKKAIERDGIPDLILTGKQSVDVEGMQTPYRLAALFDMPVVVNCVLFSMQKGTVTVERELEGDVREVIEMRMPCLIGTAKGLNQPRCPTLPDMMKARKKEIKLLEAIDLDARPAVPAVELMELQSVPERGKGMLVKGDPEEMVCALLRFLREERKVL